MIAPSKTVHIHGEKGIVKVFSVGMLFIPEAQILMNQFQKLKIFSLIAVVF